FEATTGAESRIAAYRAATGLEAGGAPAQALAAQAGEPSEAELAIPGTESTERAAGLDRALTREIQERLVAIGGSAPVSGSVNAATRAAIRSWQGAVGLEPTGYLTAAQIALLRARTQERWM